MSVSLYPNENDVTSYPYTMSGTISNNNPDQFRQPDNVGGYSEEIFILTVQPGQILTFDYMSDTVASEMRLYDNPDQDVLYFEVRLLPDLPSPPATGAFGMSIHTNVHDLPETSWYRATNRFTGLVIQSEAIWIVPAGVTEARLSLILGANNFAWPYAGIGYLPTPVPQDPTNYSITIALQSSPVSAVGNVAY